MYTAGPAFVAGACSLIGYAASVDVRYLMPATAAVARSRGEQGKPWLSRGWCLHAGVSGFILGNVVYNYYRCVTTNPGDTESEAYQELVQQATAEGLIPRRGEEDLRSWVDRDAYGWTYCRHCGEPKPPRAHYDHVTGRLVMNMDHYCPWMFNVVGYGNYHYFWRTLLYVSAFTTRLTAATFTILTDPSRCEAIGTDGVNSVIMLQSIGIGATVAVVPLFSWHVYLLSSGQTTIEFFGNTCQPRSHRQKNAMINDGTQQRCPRSP